MKKRRYNVILRPPEKDKESKEYLRAAKRVFGDEVYNMVLTAEHHGCEEGDNYYRLRYGDSKLLPWIVHKDSLVFI